MKLVYVKPSKKTTHMIKVLVEKMRPALESLAKK